VAVTKCDLAERVSLEAVEAVELSEWTLEAAEMCVEWEIMRWKQRLGLMEVRWEAGGQFGMGDGVWKGQHGSREHKWKSRSTFRNSAQHFFVSSSFQPTSSPPSHYDNYLLLHKNCAISIP
jgi:hypothetical protein